jgi:hypothetical protein
MIMTRELMHDCDKTREKNVLGFQAQKKCCITIIGLISQLLNGICPCKSVLVLSSHSSKAEGQGVLLLFTDNQIEGKSECPK